jgi:peptidoglycan/xylan/chitin deacetylase (PgdA/CDA1 family)
VPSIVELQLLNADGSYTYKDLSLLSATRGFAHESIDFTVPDGTKNVTVYHLVQQVGTLTIDNASLVKKAEFTGVFTTGAVSLRFDDGWQSQWDNAIPAMQADGLKGTFYIVSQQIADNDYSGFMSKAEIAQMAQMGEEIGAHTRTHPDLTTLTPAQQREEIDGSRQDLLSWNVGPIRSFAYPYGAYSTTTIQIVKDAGFENAAATISGDVTPTSDPYQLEDEEVQDTTSLAQVKAWIDDAATKKLWLVLTFHRVDQNCDTYCTSPQEFREIADYLKQKGIPVVTVSEGLQSMQ